MAPAVEVRLRSQSVFGRRCGRRYWDEGFDLEYDEVVNLQQQQEIIESGLVEATRHLDPGGAAATQLTNALAGVRELINRLYNTIPAIERPATDVSAVKAQEVFSTPELMEEILTYLDTDEKLSAMEVQRCWRDTVNGSVKLRRLLGLLPMEKNPRHFYSAFSSRYQDTDKFPSGHFEEIYPYCRSGNAYDDPDEEPDENEEPEPVEETIELDLCSYTRRSHNFGTRVRQMLLCSGPPLTRIEATMFDPCMTTQTRSSVYMDLGTVSSDSSFEFTVGELLDKLAVLRKKHEKCVDDPDGHTHFKLRASLKLDYEDPIMFERRYWEGRRLEYARKRWNDYREYQAKKARGEVETEKRWSEW